MRLRVLPACLPRHRCAFCRCNRMVRIVPPPGALRSARLYRGSILRRADKICCPFGFSALRALLVVRLAPACTRTAPGDARLICFYPACHLDSLAADGIHGRGSPMDRRAGGRRRMAVVKLRAWAFMADALATTAWG